MSRSDEKIKKDIVDHLYWDSRLDAAGISVTVENGSVTLSGEVPTYGDLSVARSAALGIEGVIGVTDEMTVNYPPHPPLPGDEEIRSRAQNILDWEPAIDGTAITVSVSGGVVTLEGTVDSYWKKPCAANRISGIHGVIRIDNKLAVVPTKRLSDEVIAEDVVAALDRDILVDSEKVTAAVSDGIVTLSGTVPGWVSHRAAEDDAAYTAGVIDVRNQLSINA